MDLVDAMQAVRNSSQRTAGEIYNMGGSMERAISGIRMLCAIGQETRRQSVLRYSKTRPSYISDT